MSFLGKLFGKVGRGIVKGAEVAGEVAIAAASAQAQADEDAREQQREFGDDFRNPGCHREDRPMHLEGHDSRLEDALRNLRPAAEALRSEDPAEAARRIEREQR